MRSGKEFRFRTPVFRALTLLLAAVLARQNASAVSSTELSRYPVKQRLEQVLQRLGQTAPRTGGAIAARAGRSSLAR
jgi:hypothetical protein